MDAFSTVFLKRLARPLAKLLLLLVHKVNLLLGQLHQGKRCHSTTLSCFTVVTDSVNKLTSVGDAFFKSYLFIWY